MCTADGNHVNARSGTVLADSTTCGSTGLLELFIPEGETVVLVVGLDPAIPGYLDVETLQFAVSELEPR